MKLALLPIHQLNHCVAQIPTFQPIFRKQLCFYQFTHQPHYLEIEAITLAYATV